MDPAEANGEYIGATLIEARAADGARRRRSRRPGGATPTSTTRTATRRSSTAAARWAWRRSGRSPGSRSTTTTTSPGPGRSRATTSPDAAQPAVHRHPGRRGLRARRPALRPAHLRRRARRRRRRPGPGRAGRRRDPADAGERRRLHRARRQPRGGRRPAERSCAARTTTRSSASAAAAPSTSRSTPRRGSALPMVAVATNLAHDGIASPVSSLLHEGGKGSFGVVPADGRGRRPRLRAPVAAAHGALRGRRPGQQPHGDRGLAAGRPRAWRAGRRSGGDVRPHGGRGRAAPHRRTRVGRLPHRPRRGAGAVRHGDGGRRVQPAEQRRGPRDHARDRRSCSPAPPTTASWPASAPSSRLSCARTSSSPGRSTRACAGTACPRVPADLGLTDEQFAEAVRCAPQHAAGPLHDPRAPRPRRRPRCATGSTPIVEAYRRVTAAEVGHFPVVAFRSRERPDR